MSIRTLFLSACALLSLAACENREPDRIPETQNPTILRAYTVPVERAELMQDALNRVLGKKGSASRAAPDKILVLAPAILQSSVSETIKLLVKDVPPPVAETGPVRLQVWVVDVADAGSADPRLLPVQASLDAIKDSIGAEGFALHTLLSINSRVQPGRSSHSRAGDGKAQLQARLTAAEGGVYAELNVMADIVSLETETRLRFGETVVLAQATPTMAGNDKVRLILVRATSEN